MIRVGIVGLGKMGISHYAILNSHPEVDLVAVSDTNPFVTSVLRRTTKTEVYKDFRKMLDEADLEAVVIATPTRLHYEVGSYALARGIHVFMEKPFTLDVSEGEALVKLAREREVVNQVGFHNRFVGTFAEARRLVRAQAIGDVYHVSGEAYGQVVTRPKVSTWRSQKTEGGGCLHDYASHVVDLMNWVMGPPQRVLGAHLNSIFSEGVEDAVSATFDYGPGTSGQLTTNWSDVTYRKMTTSMTVCGRAGKIVVDRQELKVWLNPGRSVEGYDEGWTVRYITDLQPPVWYYLRGQEYSAQIDAFVQNVKKRNRDGDCTFESAHQTDLVLDMIRKADEVRS